MFEDLYYLADSLKILLQNRGLKVSTAESCSGGLLSGVFTSVAGSSSFFEGGVVVYSNYQKENLLKIDPEILKHYGAVSKECALAMAQSVKLLTNTDIAISTTGIAGPDGGTFYNPIGSVYSAIIVNSDVYNYSYRFSGNRSKIRFDTVESTLVNLSNIIKEL